MKHETHISADAAHKRWWQIFEVIFGIPFLVAIALQLTVPYSFPKGVPMPVFIIAGMAFIIVGVALVVLARREFARRGQPTDPGLPTGEIVSTGIFSISRNPLYLGGICVLIGIALALNLPWVLVLLVPAIIACHYVLIAPEERYLAAAFGEEYRTYSASVHRWIGRAHHPK
jgi:protein-S-isoprenylcysteine O-methyltransferase Ste14